MNSSTSFQRPSLGDRFISQRSLNDDAANIFGTKVELFAIDQADAEMQEQRNSTQVDGSQNSKDINQADEQNKKMYAALLQNQVLGIDNPFLIHEIHDSDEHCGDPTLYTQQQRASFHDSPIREQKRSSYANVSAHKGCGISSETSPFNSKFTVLKFNSPQVSNKFHNGLASSEGTSFRQLFANASNHSNSNKKSSGNDIFSMGGRTSSSSFMSASPFGQQSVLSENVNPHYP